jgi:hypothetical protein
MRSSLLLLSATSLLAQVMTPTALQAASPSSCSSLSPGRYAVWDMGVLKESGSLSTPTARLFEERWLPGGRVEGSVVERVGKEGRRGSYSGSVSLSKNCVAVVQRQLPWGPERTEVVLDGRGRPLYGLIRQEKQVITSSWLPMASGSCRSSDLNGLVLSRQTGLNASSGGGWIPNAVVQREQWKDGKVQGLALASYGGHGESAGYSGELKLDPGSCWGSLVEKDQFGVTYNYWALIVNGRKDKGARGYLYLQRDPGNLTAAWLVRD